MTDYSSALRDVTSKVFTGSERHREQQWRANRKGAHPDILDFERIFIRRMAKMSVPMFAHCVIRTDEEQDRLFKAGRSKARAGQSPHGEGYAVDIVHGLKAWDMDEKTWAILGHLGKEVAAANGIDIEWGGDWAFYDPAHWQLRGWKTMPKLRAPY